MADEDWSHVNPLYEDTEAGSFDLNVFYTVPIPPVPPPVPVTVVDYTVSYIVNPYYTCTASLVDIHIVTTGADLKGYFPVQLVGWIEERGGIRHDVTEWIDVPFGKYLVEYVPSPLSQIDEVITCTANLSDSSTATIIYYLYILNDRSIGQATFLQKVSEAGD
jgi:hypothetical protein